MANVDNTKLIQFYTGTALPQSPVEGHVYFIHNEGKGKLYKGGVLIAETNDLAVIESINGQINAINQALATKATKEELQQHVVLYQTLVETVTGINNRLTTAEGGISTNAGEIAKNAAAIKTNEGNIASNLGEINQLKTKMTAAEKAIDDIEADYLKAADKTELSGLITAEKTRAEGAESALDLRIDSLEAKTDSIQGDVAGAISAAVDAEKQRAEGEEAKLAGRIKAVEDDYLKAADKTALQAEIDADILVETNRAKAAEEALDGRMTTAEGNITTLQGQVGTLGNALHFRGAGKFENRPTSDLKEGDVYVVIDPEHENDGKEYIYTGTEWMEFGDVSDYATKVELLAEENRAKLAEKTLDDAIKAEKERAEAAELVNANAIVAEKNRAEAIEKEIKDAADALKTRVDAFDTILDEGGTVTEAIANMAGELKQYADQAEADAIATAKDYTDAEIVKVNGTISGLDAAKADKTALETLAGRVTTAEGDIDALEGRATAVEGRATNLENELNTAETGLKARMSAAETAIGVNEAAIGVNAADIQALYNALQWHQVI
jgi:chromosome segregation ATPase